MVGLQGTTHLIGNLCSVGFNLRYESINIRRINVYCSHLIYVKRHAVVSSDNLNNWQLNGVAESQFIKYIRIMK